MASVAQNVESRGKQGLPLLGLIPILGRLFTAPTRDNRQVDIVIAVTPRVIRAPAILPEDEAEHPTGSQMAPTNNSLEAMIMQDEQDELLAAARRIPNAAEVQMPDRQAEAPGYVKTVPRATITAAITPATNPETAIAKKPETSEPTLKPIDNGVRTLQLNQTADTSKGIDLAPSSSDSGDKPKPEPSEVKSTPTADIKMGLDLNEMKVGDKVRIPVMVQGSTAFRSAVLSLKFDEKRLPCDLSVWAMCLERCLNTPVTPFLNQNGKMFVSM